MRRGSTAFRFEQHDDRYARTSEWLDVLNGVWSQDHFSYAGKYYRVEDNVLEPKPVSKPRPCIVCGRRIAGGEGFDRGEVRRVSDAWRSAGARGREDFGFADATREAFGIWRR